jgi:carbamate kinase
MVRVVIALGGNALLDAADGTLAEQLAAIRATAAEIVSVIEAGHDVVLTHGNGPQVGNLILQQEAAPGTPQLSLDVLVAETQAQIGYLLQQALDNELDGQRDFVTVVTQVVVDADDPAFEDPSKPVGPTYAAAEAADKPFPTMEVREGTYRRVVPSPDPIAVVESEQIRDMVASGTLVICGGGGGVPVVADGALDGVEAVVDKDATSALLADDLEADVLAILTDVPYAYRDFESDDQRPIERATPTALRSLLRQGAFGRGSMAPKVRACADFVASGGERAAITTPDRLQAALDGDAGTQIRPP